MPKPPSIVVDWGTTSLRADLVDADGTVLDHRETAEGISTLGGTGFEAVLMTALAPWFAEHGPVPVIALGMITSRNGWVEVPYVPCPASIADLAAGTLLRVLPNGAPLTFLAGLTDPSCRPFPDVMRGEETQVAGFGLDTDGVVVLPGTHSKWARVAGGRITGFQTFVTGEIFALLARHSFIARGAVDPAEPDLAAFRRGLAESERAPAMLSLLFSARTGVLAGRLAPAEIGDYVSGLVIGQEFRQARESDWFRAGDAVGIVGNDGLNARYAIAANIFGLTVRDGGETAAIAGALAILAEASIAA